MSATLKTGWSDKVRQLAERDYVEPARGSKSTITIRFGDLKAKLLKMGFPQGHANQVASPLESAKFWKPLGLEMCSPKGQPRTVDSLLEFRFIDEPKSSQSAAVESPEARAFRLTEKIRGLMKDEIAAHGGGEAYLRWVRGEDEAAA